MSDKSTKKRQASDLLVECLVSENVLCILGIPGEENADFMRSLENSPIRFISTRHEQSAAFAASAYGKLTGRPLACLGTLGPGAANLVTGVADGNMDHAPMLVLTGQGSTRRLHKESHQIMDVISMFEPITKWATSIRDVDAIPEIARKAVRLTVSEKPGAVLIELPEDVAKQPTDHQPLESQSYRRPVPPPEAVSEAAKLLAGAKRPIVLTGNGTIRCNASNALREFIETLGLSATSTFMGKGAVDFESPHSLFTVGIQQKDEIGCALSSADVVLTVGYDMVEYPPEAWTSEHTKIIHLDTLPAEVDSVYQPAVELVGDIGPALDQLRQKCVEDGMKPFGLSHLRGVREAMQQEFNLHADDDTTGSIRPQKMLYDIRQALDPGDVVLSGVGAHKMWIGRHYQCNEPNTCLIPNGFCSMGQSLPGLIGAKLARPDDRVVSVGGDGDFLMNVQEMETIARLGLDVTAIVWEDHAYGLIAWKQEAEFGSHTELSFTNPNWTGLAESFGWRGEHVENSRDFAPALARSLEHPGPALLVASVDYRENMKLTERLGRTVCRI